MVKINRKAERRTDNPLIVSLLKNIDNAPIFQYYMLIFAFLFAGELIAIMISSVFLVYLVGSIVGVFFLFFFICSVVVYMYRNQYEKDRPSSIKGKDSISKAVKIVE